VQLTAWLRERLFTLGLPLCWLQLIGEKKRFLTAVTGVTFAVTLMLYQLGVYDAVFAKVVFPHQCLRGELVMTSRDYSNFYANAPFSIHRLTQMLGDPDVIAVAPVMIGYGDLRNPETRQNRKIAVLGVRSGQNPFAVDAITAQLGRLTNPEAALFDARSQNDFGPVSAWFARRGEVHTELNHRRLLIRGLFPMGGTISAAGHVLLNEQGFQRVFPDRPPNLANVGIIQLRPGADPTVVCRRLQRTLPVDVAIQSHAAFVEAEKQYWQQRSPIAFIFLGTMLVAMLVGSVIVYQILYTDVSDHLREYATLKAIGLADGFFITLVLQQAAILLAFGFAPGLLFTAGLNAITRRQGAMPTHLTGRASLIVFGCALVMCGVAALLSTRKLRRADPADVF
jgi:putative ABC transport system permease protein